MEEKIPMPVWLDNYHLDPAWLQQCLLTQNDKKILQCSATDKSQETRKAQTGARDGATLLLNIQYTKNNTETPMTMILKQVPPETQTLSKRLGLAREALFYQHLAPKVEDARSSFIPKIYYSYGDMESGAKAILIEDLSHGYLDSGVLFGPGNPSNWNRNLPEQIRQAYHETDPPSPQQVAHVSFQAMSKVHATFWNDESLLALDFLRGAAWMRGQQESWQASQNLILGMHQKGIEDKIKWNPLVKETVDKAMGGISWQKHWGRLHPNLINSNNWCHWTLVHGDFWPGNVLVSTKSVAELKVLDWEMVGIGSGPQDLGQYVLSNMSPEVRRECEEQLIRDYYKTLLEKGGTRIRGFSWEECWREYKLGGLERWLWFLVYFCGQEGPLLKWAQFFHDQIASFMQDHGIQPQEVTQPRP